MYRTGRVGVCLIAAMIYISLVCVKLFVPDWSEENQAEADANLAKDIYFNDDDDHHEVNGCFEKRQEGCERLFLSPTSTRAEHFFPS